MVIMQLVPDLGRPAGGCALIELIREPEGKVC